MDEISGADILSAQLMTVFDQITRLTAISVMIIPE